MSQLCSFSRHYVRPSFSPSSILSSPTNKFRSLSYIMLRVFELLAMPKLTIVTCLFTTPKKSTRSQILCVRPIRHRWPRISPPSTLGIYLPDKSMLSGTRMRPIQMRVQHSTYTAFHRLDRLRQQFVKLLDSTGLSGPQVAASGRLGYACIVG